jgi:micrococcal nuclease
VSRGPCVVAAILLALSTPTGLEACALDQGTSRVAARLEGADTIILDDGREALLIGIVPPTGGLAVGPRDTTWPPAEASRRALDALVVGQTVEVATAGRRIDRYGRLLVHAFVQRGAERVWVQRDLVERGLARAFAITGNVACLDELIESENEARTARRGHWGTGVFQDRDAEDAGAFYALRDTFQTVEGRVETVKRVRGQTIIRFVSSGAVIFEVQLAQGKWAGDKLERLAGRRVRVRGYIEVQRRPFIRIPDPVMVEAVDDAPPVPSQPDGQAAQPERGGPIPALAPR